VPANQPISIAAALALATKLAKRGPIANPNPRVGAVLLDQTGKVLGTGWHMGAGTPHAEVAALTDARQKGHDVNGATLVCTLEPCNHQGVTGPCAGAIIEAGIAKVVYAVADPGVRSGGGAVTLAQHGVAVSQQSTPKAEQLVQVWSHAIRTGRPYVTLKMATTLDGYVAAADGTSKWITGPAARTHAGKFRAKMGAILVTTGTVFADDPALTARLPDGSLAPHQPLAVVVGLREIPATAQIRNASGGFQQFHTHDVAAVLTALANRGIRQVLIEGGPALATACLAAGVVDELHAYLAPSLLGQGRSAVAPFGAVTLPDAAKFTLTRVRRLGNDVFLAARSKV